MRQQGPHTPAISSNTLFHFTSSRDNLINILENEFLPHFCLENFRLILPEHARPRGLEFAVPMVSFCDLPLSQTAAHLNVYGRYGIGMSKHWGIVHGVSPVLYAHPSAPIRWTIQAVGDVLAHLRAAAADDGELATRALDEMFRFLSYIKPYEGRLWHGDEYGAKVRFYDEREWRYVPELKDHALAYGLDKADFVNAERRTDANRSISRLKIPFNPMDIRYVIVASEAEVPEMIADLRRIKDKYDERQVDMLITRLISAERIAEDV
jgi:hypothetical protein